MSRKNKMGALGLAFEKAGFHEKAAECAARAESLPATPHVATAKVALPPAFDGLNEQLQPRQFA